MIQEISTKAAASQFKNGWAYANGIWISKTFFPKAFDVLKSAGLATSGDKVRLPNLSGFLYGAGTDASNSGGPFKQDPQAYGLPKHRHNFEFDSSLTEKTLIRNASWIYSTKSAGAGIDEMPEFTYVVDGVSFVIPKNTPTAHSGKCNNSLKTGRFPRIKVWDIPVNASSTTAGKISTTTGESEVASFRPVIDGEICPRHIRVNALIYIGRPQGV